MRDPVDGRDPRGHLSAREALGEDDAERLRGQRRHRGRRRGGVAAQPVDRGERAPAEPAEDGSDEDERDDAPDQQLAPRRAAVAPDRRPRLDQLVRLLRHVR